MVSISRVYRHGSINTTCNIAILFFLGVRDMQSMEGADGALEIG